MAESRHAVVGAIVANVAIAATKFAVAILTGSSVMLSEGVHSMVDTGNELLLLVGLKLSKRPPSAKHPFGHGKDLFFWSLIVAVLIFGVGGGVSFYEGLMHVRHPVPLEDPTWNYIVLGAAALFEGVSFAIALKQFKLQNQNTPFWRALRISKDPATYTVLAEDSAALLGLAIAALGIYASQTFHEPAWDGAASLLIGVLLAGTAVLLMSEARGLLLGEGIRRDTARAVRRIAGTHRNVRQVGHPLSMYLGSDEILLALDVEFDRISPADEVAATIREIEHQITERYPMIRRIYIEARSAADMQTGPAPDERVPHGG